MVQERTRASQRSKSASEAAQNGPPLAIKKKVVRRDPEKRRLQNRLAQQTYSKLDRRDGLDVPSLLYNQAESVCSGQWLT
jgi:hypothetical protein